MKDKPRREPHQMKARFQFAQKHMSWKTEWSTVVWTDKFFLNLDSLDCLRYYWHDIRHKERNIFRRKFGGKSMTVWAGFLQNGETYSFPW